MRSATDLIIPRKMARELHTRSHARNNLGNKGCRRVRFRFSGPVGYGPTMWVKSRKGVDILHGHDSKACQRVACQLYVSNNVGTKGEGRREPPSCSLNEADQ